MTNESKPRCGYYLRNWSDVVPQCISALAMTVALWHTELRTASYTPTSTETVVTYRVTHSFLHPNKHRNMMTTTDDVGGGAVDTNTTWQNEQYEHSDNAIATRASRLKKLHCVLWIPLTSLPQFMQIFKICSVTIYFLAIVSLTPNSIKIRLNLTEKKQSHGHTVVWPVL